MATELTLIPAPQLVPNGLPAVLNELKMEDGSSFGHFNVTHLVNSPGNRKRFSEDGLQQLAASIREKGVAQPILIRPLPAAEDGTPRWEVIAGERRWRSSVMAPINHIPATCRPMTDQEADELQILENLQREDPHPLEEAEGYERMMLKHGYSADQLAERVKKSRAYIYARIKLCALSLSVRESFLDNAIPASTALLIARIPVPGLQQQALAEILKPQFNGEPMSYRQAVAHISRCYTLELESAPFDITDGKLVADAGNCLKCPKRTGNQSEIFKDAKSADVCTDTACFAEKKAAHYQRIELIASKRGTPVLEGEAAAVARRPAWTGAGDLVIGATHLSTFERVAPGTGMSGSVYEHLAAEERPTPVKYLKDDDGELEAVYKRSDVQKALEKKGACETKSAREKRLAKEAENPAPQAKLNKAQEAALAQQKEREDKQRRADAMTLERVTRYRKLRAHISTVGGLNTPMLRELAKAMVRDCNISCSLPDDLIGDLYDFERDDESVCAYIDQADYPTIQLLMMDLIVGENLGVGIWDLDDAPAPSYLAVQTMADAEGIEVMPVDLALAGIDIDALEDAVDVRNAITENVEHLSAVAAHIIDKAPHHLSNVEVAANSLGYFHSTEGWQKKVTPEQSDSVEEVKDTGLNGFEAIAPTAAPARAKLKLKVKTEVVHTEPAGPVIKVRKNRAAQVQTSAPLTAATATWTPPNADPSAPGPTAAWPFPTKRQGAQL